SVEDAVVCGRRAGELRGARQQNRSYSAVPQRRNRTAGGARGEATMGTLDGRVALVTGASSGLGAATARRFVAEGAMVASLDLREAEAATVSHVADVTDEDAVAAVVRSVVDAYGRLDVVGN